MKKFTVVWTYIANYGVYRNFEASSAEAAAKSLIAGFSEDFAQRGKVYVFEGEPAFIVDPQMDPHDSYRTRGEDESPGGLGMPE